MSTLFFTFECTGVESIEVEVHCKVRLGSLPHYSVSHGNWLPGDAPSVEVESIDVNGEQASEEMKAFWIKAIGLNVIEQEAIEDESPRDSLGTIKQSLKPA